MAKQEKESEKHQFLRSGKSWRHMPDPYKIKVIDREYIIKYLLPVLTKSKEGRQK